MALKFCESLFLWINNFIVFWRIKVFTTDASCLVCSLKINLCDHWHASSNTSALKKERKAENKLSVMDLFQKYHNTLCCPSKISEKHCFQFLLGQIIHYCWFAHNVTAFVFGHVGGKWTHIFMSILREKILLYWPPTWLPCHVFANQEYIYWVKKKGPCGEVAIGGGLTEL